MNGLTIIMLLAFVLAIGLGFKSNINTGYFALAFAFIIGCFIMKFKPAELVGMWPLSIFFVLVFVSMFYNIPIQNGTLDKLAMNLIYKFGRTAKVLPFILFLSAWIMSAMGAGPYSILMLLCPIAFKISEKLGMNRLLCGVAVYFGAVNGGTFPSSSTAVMARTLTSSLGYENEAMQIQMRAFPVGLSIFLIYLLILYIILKGYKVNTTGIVVTKPEPYTPEQKKSFALILIFIVALLFPYVLGLFVKAEFVTLLKRYMDVGFISIILTIVALLLKLGDGRKILGAVPWNTVIMVSGVGILVNLAVEAGVVGLLAGAVGSLENKSMVGMMMGMIAGIMSIFSSTSGVVIPTLYPVVPALSQTTGLAAFYLFASISSGSVSTGMSPFSACGALMLGSVSEEEAKGMYLKLIAVAGGGLILAMTELFILGLIVN